MSPINTDIPDAEIPANARDLIVALRGGVPETCDYCGLPSLRLHPDEGDTWICDACIARIGYT